MPIYDWQSFLEVSFKPLLGIKQIHHFRFFNTAPGIVYYKIKPNDAEQSFRLLQSDMLESNPSVILPPGLPLMRQWYLYNKIRWFVDEKEKDVTCPEPLLPPGPVTIPRVREESVAGPSQASGKRVAAKRPAKSDKGKFTDRKVSKKK